MSEDKVVYVDEDMKPIVEYVCSETDVDRVQNDDTLAFFLGLFHTEDWKMLLTKLIEQKDKWNFGRMTVVHECYDSYLQSGKDQAIAEQDLTIKDELDEDEDIDRDMEQIVKDVFDEKDIEFLVFLDSNEWKIFLKKLIEQKDKWNFGRMTVVKECYASYLQREIEGLTRKV